MTLWDRISEGRPDFPVFVDRADAGRQLAALVGNRALAHPLVLGLARGGVPVAAEVASALSAPLDVLLVRKLGVPDQPELALGAIGEGGVRVINEEVRRATGVGDRVLAALEGREREQVARQARLFRSGRMPRSLDGRTVVIVDDGIATGSTVAAACVVARAQRATQVTVAVPVAPARILAGLSAVADDVVCIRTPPTFFAIGQWYTDFTQVSDDEVRELLGAADVRGLGGQEGSGPNAPDWSP